MAIQSKNSQVQCLKPSTQIANFRQKLNYCERSLLNTITQRIYNTKDHLSKIEIEMGLRIHRLINFKRERLQSRIETLEAINPKKLLEIGYSILFSEKTGSVIKSVHQMKKDDTIRLLLKDGEAVTTVKELFSSD